MRIMHRISFNAKCGANVARELKAIGVKLEGTEGQNMLLFHFEMGEDDRRWPGVEALLKWANIGTNPEWTEFTEEEIASAEWVQILPTYLWGYPMPDLDGGWKTVSFTHETQCPICGEGLVQKAPIHLKGEPELEGNDFMGVFWTYSVFARPDIFDVLFASGIGGFEVLPVIDHTSHTCLRAVQQLKIVSEIAPCVIADNLTRDSNTCGHMKYRGLSRGMYRFRRSAFADLPDLAVTNEWFGGGHAAHQLVLASADFVHLYLAHRWRGLSLHPIELI